VLIYKFSYFQREPNSAPAGTFPARVELVGIGGNWLERVGNGWKWLESAESINRAEFCIAV